MKDLVGCTDSYQNISKYEVNYINSMKNFT